MKISTFLDTLAYNGFILAVAEVQSWGRDWQGKLGIMAVWALLDSVIEAIRVLASLYTFSWSSHYRLDSNCYSVYSDFVEAM